MAEATGFAWWGQTLGAYIAGLRKHLSAVIGALAMTVPAWAVLLVPPEILAALPAGVTEWVTGPKLWLWPVLGILALLFANFLLFADARRGCQELASRVAQLETRLAPSLGVDYREGEPPYFQKRRLDGPAVGAYGDRRVPLYERVFRVGVRNLSGVTIRKVRMVLADAEGEHSRHQSILRGHRLRVMDTGQGEVDVNPASLSTAFFDVVSHTLEPELHAVDDLEICYAVALVGSLPTDPGTEWRLMLRLEGENVLSVTTTLRLWIDAENVAHLSPA